MRGLRSSVLRAVIFRQAVTPTARISLDALTAALAASVGTRVGTLSVPYSTGSPAFTLDDDAGGLFVLDGADVEVASALTTGQHTITVSVEGTTPDPNPRDFVITVYDDVAPTITSSDTVSVSDDAQLSHSLTANETVTWSIVGGIDQDHFQIATAELQWTGDGTRDYDAPTDENLDNDYVVIVRATDTGNPANTTDQEITVTVGVSGGGAAQAWRHSFF